MSIGEFIEDAQNWKCSACGKHCNPGSADWRWCGHCWQHQHPEAQSYFDAVRTCPTPEKFEAFGRAVWKMVTDNWPDILASEQWTEVMDAAGEAGLAELVKYDPKKHGACDAQPGDDIWWLKVDCVPEKEGGAE